MSSLNEMLEACQKGKEFGTTSNLIISINNTKILIIKYNELGDVLCCIGRDVGVEVIWDGPNRMCRQGLPVSHSCDGDDMVEIMSWNLER